MRWAEDLSDMADRTDEEGRDSRPLKKVVLMRCFP
jgi:hypothetical protein